MSRFHSSTSIARPVLLCAALGGVCLAMWRHHSVSSPSTGKRISSPSPHSALAPSSSPSAVFPATSRPSAALPARLAPRSAVAAKILAAAKAQSGTVYDASYQTIPYPGGDVRSDRGACTDVVTRALRKAGYDLQQLIHNDMKQQWRAYPHQWGLKGTDTNIDHRRVPNQKVYFQRHGQALPLDTKGAHLQTWQPGDIVQWNLRSDGGKLPHTGIISDTRNAKGEPFAIHNLSVCAEEDVLNAWTITGHFRFPVGTPSS